MYYKQASTLTHSILKIMKRNKEITIFSTFTKDKIIDEQGTIMKEEIGGPAFYLSNVFTKEDILFNLVTGPVMEIEVLMTESGEVGKVNKKSKIRKIDFSKVKTPFIAISTILKDFDLINIFSFKGKIFLDIQGYVRDGTKLGGKQHWIPSKKIMSSIFCLKGTEEEIKYISPSFIEQQKQKTMIITKGSLGCDVFVNNKKYMIKPQKQISILNTIGAGDTFFAYLITHFLKGTELLESAEYAVNKTSDFLIRR